MKYVLLAVFMSCASTSSYHYEEMGECPTHMTSEEHESGVVRCRAMCSSYARDFAEYTRECKCLCLPDKNSAPVYRQQIPSQM